MLKDDYYTEPTEVDQLVFAKLVHPDHYLRRAKEVIDFERFRDVVKDCYSASMGRGAEDPVRMIKLEFLQFHYDLSDRDVIAEAQVNVAFRFFLDLSLDSCLPVPSLLSQFRTRLGSERHRGLFDQVVSQARAHGLMHDRLRLKDATHVWANIAVPTTLQLVAQTRQRLLESIRVYWPERVVEEEAEALRLREVTADLKDVDRLTARVAHLRSIVAWAEATGVLSCPGGQHTSSRARNPKDTGWKYTFARRACAQCPLHAQCLEALPQHKGRTVTKNDYQADYDAARQRATTEAYHAARRQHPRVERKLADMVCNQGGRRTRYRGRWRVHIQYLLTGMVVNIKRMVKLLSPRGAQPAQQPV